MDLKSEILKHITEDTYNNILNRQSKCIGIESLSDVKNESNKRVGRILMIHYSDAIPDKKRKKTLLLGMFVSFNQDKILWSSGNFYLIDPYFVKSYLPDPKVEVPVNVFDPKTLSMGREIMSLTYKQFQERRLNEFFVKKKMPYHWVNAYNNFRRVFTGKGQYYLAINSTIKHCWITQGDLLHIISVINNHKKAIKNEWMKYINNQMKNNNSIKIIEELYKENETTIVEERDLTKVIDFPKQETDCH